MLRRALVPAFGGMLAAGLGALGCHNVFTCAQDEQCRLDGAQGVCELDGFCSFPDGSCPSGRRYGQHASAALADACVVEPVATSDGTTTAGDATLTSEGDSLSADGGTSMGASASASTDASTGGPIVDTEFDPCEGLVDSDPVVANANDQVIEGLRIIANGGPGIVVSHFDGVTIRNCEIHQIDGPGISFSDAHHIRIEDVVVVHDAAPRSGSHLDDNQIGIEGSNSNDVGISRVRLEDGSSGIELESTPGAQLSFIEVHDVRGPGNAACVRVHESDLARIEDFSCENDLHDSRPEHLIAIDDSSNVTVSRGLLDGHNSQFGYGIYFIQNPRQASGGLVEDVDGIRQTNGAFSCFDFGADITFRRTRARENICDIVTVEIPDCVEPGTTGCKPGSGGITWNASRSASESINNKIEDSVYFDLCDDPTYGEFIIETGDLVEEDFEPRAPIRITGCWEP